MDDSPKDPRSPNSVRISWQINCKSSSCCDQRRMVFTETLRRLEESQEEHQVVCRW